ncbi:LLM class flavin-dependent oxidoreductase [Actinokineospora guangxiensis]|uniref:LLM class flavin-dependent oxidoreductase n=1 Tax=Actinokineospora guangxiensis TaxID=1490288 RepID=A0ABW0EPE4_9PSEU
MSLGVLVPRDLPIAEFPGYVRRAEAAGFDELWVVEDLYFRGGVAQAAAALAATERIRVGIGILPAPLRNPALTAVEAHTLAELFPGRLILGIGHGMPGWMAEVGAAPVSPLRVLEEHLTVVRSLLHGSSAELAATVRLDLTVTAPAPPVLAGVRGPRSLALSGRVADGTLLAEPVTPEYLAAARAAIGVADHHVAAYNFAAVDTDPDRARAAVRPLMAWLGEPDWAPHIAPLDFADEFAALRAECADGAEFAARVPDEWVDRLTVSGTPERARARVAELREAGADSVILIPVDADLDGIAALVGH